MAVIQYRLDGRMLHGQVSNFARALNIEEFVVVNEKTANDPTQVLLLELEALNAEVDAVSPEDAYDLLTGDELEDYRVMVVFKEIFDAVELVKLGYSMPEIVISGMYAKDNENKVKAEACLFVDDKDKEAFRYLEDHGVLLTHQISPEYNKKMVHDLVKF